MVRQNNEFILAWGSLSGSTEKAGWRSIPISAAGPILIHVGRRFPGNEEALLVAFANTTIPADEKLPDAQGFWVERADPNGEGKTWLALTRKAAGGLEIFSTMARDVAGALEAEHVADEPRLLRVLLGRVRAWQEFMRKGGRVLSPEAEIGLIGELTFLRAIMQAGVSPPLAMEAWVGPYDAEQDFALGAGAVEVKATMSSYGFTAKIASLEQLDDSVRKPLFMAGARLSERESGRSLPDFASSVREMLDDEPGAAAMFSDRLLAAGYHGEYVDHYKRRFSVEGIRVMEVRENFPRIVPGNVPAGIRKVIYEIDFDRAPGVDVGVMGALRKLGAL
ncbi:MAG: PD-(D/E)XK motif protein [Gammaproteobacteria bacterium]|jgi:hypothetical protein|nr:PD-(D/E)XK motif protein [Gammaproteobacteria bacterium]